MPALHDGNVQGNHLKYRKSSGRVKVCPAGPTNLTGEAKANESNTLPDVDLEQNFRTGLRVEGFAGSQQGQQQEEE